MWGLAVAVVVLTALALWVIRRRQTPVFPGPRGWPFLGVATQVTNTAQFCQTLEGWAEQYGGSQGVYEFELMGKRFVVASKYDSAMQMFRKRPFVVTRTPIFRDFNDWGLNGLFTAEGTQWNTQRRLIAPSFNHIHLRDYFGMIERVTCRLVDVWRAQLTANEHAQMRGRTAGDPERKADETPVTEHTQCLINVTATAANYTADVTALVAFGHDFDSLRRPCKEAQYLRDVFVGLQNRVTAPFPYWKIPFSRQLGMDRAFLTAIDSLRVLMQGLHAKASRELAEQQKESMHGSDGAAGDDADSAAAAAAAAASGSDTAVAGMPSDALPNGAPAKPARAASLTKGVLRQSSTSKLSSQAGTLMWKMLEAQDDDDGADAADGGGDGGGGGSGGSGAGARKLSRDDVIGNLFVFFLAGTDTTSHSISWCLYRLARDQALQAEVRDEVNACLGLGGATRAASPTVATSPATTTPGSSSAGSPRALHSSFSSSTSSSSSWPQRDTGADTDTAPLFGELAVLKECVLLRAVLCETMRLAGVASYLMLGNTEPIELLGKTIPAHTELVVMLRLLAQADEAAAHIGPDPKAFHPRRWINTDGSFKTVPFYSTLHFGHGARLCVGKDLAEVEAMCVVAHVLHAFQLDVPLGAEAAPIGRMTAFTIQPDRDICVRVSPLVH